MMPWYTHFGADGTCHDGPGGMFYCERCDDPPEQDPDDAEAQLAAEVNADAAAEMHWIDEAGA